MPQVIKPFRTDATQPIPLGFNNEKGLGELHRACDIIRSHFGLPPLARASLRLDCAEDDLLDNLSQFSGLLTRQVTLKGRWIYRDAGPILAFQADDGAPVVLLSHLFYGYRARYPGTDCWKRVPVSVVATLHSTAYSFDRPLPARKIGSMELLRFGISACRDDLLLIILLGVVVGLCGMGIPVMTGIALGRLIPNGLQNTLLQFGEVLFMLTMASTLFMLTCSFCTLRLEGRLDKALESALWNRVFSLPASFFRDYSAGDLTSRVLGLTAMRQVFSGYFIDALFSIPVALFSVLLLLFYNWKLAFVTITIVLLLAAFTVIQCVLHARIQRKVLLVSGQISGMLLQFLNGIAVFRVSGAENRVFSAWARLFLKKKHLSVRSRKYMMQLNIFIGIFPAAALAGIFYAHQTFAPTMSQAYFLAFIAAFVPFIISVMTLAATCIVIFCTIPAYERIRPVLESLPELREGQLIPELLHGDIAARHLSFSYNDDSVPVLHDIGFSVRRGQFIGIVGSSGSGKSTLCRLLIGFDTPAPGTIFYDNHDLLELNHSALRRRMGIVLQGAVPHSGTILSNITGNGRYSEAAAWHAASLAACDDEIRAMPMGMHTQVGESGVNLSGGQRQRIMIARALCGNPSILILDESTNQIDAKRETYILQNLARLECTRIVVAHRLSTIRDADWILVLQGGVIIEQGAYPDLVNRGGVFTRLYSEGLHRTFFQLQDTEGIRAELSN